MGEKDRKMGWIWGSILLVLEMFERYKDGLGLGFDGKI